jgi:hypothetical protein
MVKMEGGQKGKEELESAGTCRFAFDDVYRRLYLTQLPTHQLIKMQILLDDNALKATMICTTSKFPLITFLDPKSGIIDVEV